MKYMFKFAGKLLLTSALFTLTLSFASGEEASAQSCHFGGNDNFGVEQTGQHSNAMGGLKVKARYALGGPINTDYTIRSNISGPGGDGKKNGHPVDERIFRYPAGEGGRTDKKTFSTGERLYNGSGSFRCPGKSVIGPGDTATERGNGWVLDCGEEIGDRGNVPTEFWISNIDSPGNQKGRWSMVIDGDTTIHDVANARLSKLKFNIANGDNVRIDLIWHPAERPDFELSASCPQQRLRIYNVRDQDVPANTNLRYRVWRGDGNGNKVGSYIRTGHVSGIKDISISMSSREQFIVKIFGQKYGGGEDGVDRERQTKANRCDGRQPSNEDRCRKLRIENVGTYNGFPTRIRVIVERVDVRKFIHNDGEEQNVSQKGIKAWIPGPNGEWNPNKKTSKEWRYWPNDNDIKIEVFRQVWSSDRNKWVDLKNSNDQRIYQINETRDCFSAECRDMEASGNGPGKIIIAGDKVNISGTYENTSPSPDNMPLGDPVIQAKNGPYDGDNFPRGDNNIADELKAGEEGPINFTVDAPDDITSTTWRFRPIYFDEKNIGPECEVTIRTYKRFEADIHAFTNLTPTQEDPSNAEYETTVDVTPSSPKVHIPTESRFYKDNFNGGENTIDTDSGGTYPGTDLSGNYNIPANSFEKGDRFCTFIEADYTVGYRGPGGSSDIKATSSPDSDSSCPDIHDRPYLHAFGGDVSAGLGGFNNPEGSCSTEGGISTYTNIGNSKGGSGAQFAALSSEPITGFVSAMLTARPIGLSFANQDSNVNNSDNQPLLGGSLNANSCVTNYFETTRYEEGDKMKEKLVSSISPKFLPDNQQTYIKRNTVEINGASGYNKKHTVYVEGDVRINGNITYAGYNSIGEIPNFTLVVKGNIYIDPDVEQLDGIYIAQPSEQSGSGQIYTCVQNSNGQPFNELSDIAGVCNNPLTVYGSLIATNINFLRTHQTLRNSTPGENASSSKAAERIIYTPEIYLSPPVFNLPGSTDDESQLSTGRNDSITTLPPIL